MSIISELKNIKFIKNSGISNFLQDQPNLRFKKINDSGDSVKVMHYSSIADINDLDELEIFTKKFDNCHLKKTANKTVFSDGNHLSNVMLIGEAPGAEEDIQGKPFVGQAGKLLDKMLASIKLDRSSVYITNIVPWRPPNNRQPSTEEIFQCLPLIQKHIEIIKPNLLILLGGTAAKALLGTTIGISKLRGIWHNYNSLNLKKKIKTRATYHPAYLLRSPEHKKESWQDLIEIQKFINKYYENNT